MLAAFTKLKHAQKVKQFLVKKKALDHDYLPIKELDHLYFPLVKKIKVPHAKVVNTKDADKIRENGAPNETFIFAPLEFIIPNAKTRQQKLSVPGGRSSGLSCPVK